MDFSKEKDPAQEIVLYREKALKAAALGKEKLAGCWRLAADEARQVVRQQTTTAVFRPQVVSFISQLALLSYSNQEGNYYLSHQCQPSEAFHWAFARDETKEAVAAYRYWIVFARAGTSKNFEEEIKQTMEAVSQYSLDIPEASHAAGEAVSCFKKAQEALSRLNQQDAFQHELVIHRWKKAAYAALHLAVIHIQGRTSVATQEPALVRSWTQLIELSQEALSLRLKAVEATQRSAEEEVIHYCLAACALSNAVDYLLRLVETPEQYSEGEVIKKILLFAKKISCYRVRSSEAWKTNGIAAWWSKAAFWMENTLDTKCIAEEVTAKKSEYPLLSFYWEESCKASEQAAAIVVRAVRARASSHSLASFFWEKVSYFFEARAQKKIPSIFFGKTSFCLMDYFLPSYEWRKKWEEGGPIHFDADSKSPMITSWIYQTWSLLQKAGVECALSTEFPWTTSDGIFLTMSKLLEPSIIRQASSDSLFLVDILGDGGPHGAANLHLVQNRGYTRYLPSSIFVPHWPQPFLRSRDPERGRRFENVCFFGEIQNLAPELRSKEWRQRLQQELGLHFKIRAPHEWNDYRDIDCVVAIRDFSNSSHIHKPATKLYNAWLAGVPFIGGRDSAYAADGSPGKNYLVATSLEELLKHLKHLQENTNLRSMLVQHGLQAGQAFTQEATLHYWKKLVEETIPVRAFQWKQRSALGRAWVFWIHRIICKTHHFYFDHFLK
ncbi:MAG: glycosyltransferase [Chthoniobacterales bacterium]